MNTICYQRNPVPPRLTVAVTVSEAEVYQKDCFASVGAEAEAGEIDLLEIHQALSQAAALNYARSLARTDVLICPHQDVFFLPGWRAQLAWLLDTTPEPWGVIGAAGTALGGQMYGTHSGLGMNTYRHVDVQTLDGSLLIIRKSSGLTFDERLTRFHGYDLDICLEAASRGLRSFVVALPMEHRTRWKSTEGAGAGDLQAALQFLKAKWSARGVPTIYSTIGTY